MLLFPLFLFLAAGTLFETLKDGAEGKCSLAKGGGPGICEKDGGGPAMFEKEGGGPGIFENEGGGPDPDGPDPGRPDPGGPGKLGNPVLLNIGGGNGNLLGGPGVGGAFHVGGGGSNLDRSCSSSLSLLPPVLLYS